MAFYDTQLLCSAENLAPVGVILRNTTDKVLTDITV